MAKWLFTPRTATTAVWVVPPLGIDVEPTALSAGRAVAAFVILLAYLALERRPALRIGVRDLWFLAPFGVVGLAGVHFTYFKAISLTGVATAILLEYLAPVVVLLVGVAFLGHRFTWSLPAGIALSVLGCALVVGAFGSSASAVSAEGVAWGLLAAVFFATYSLMGGVAAVRFSPYTTLMYGLGFASAFWLAVLGPGPVVSLFAQPQTAVAVLLMAVVGTIVPFASFLAALRDIPPTNATVTSTVEPAIAGVGAFLLFGESLTVLQLLGGVLVVAAIAVVQLPQKDPAPVLPPQE